MISLVEGNSKTHQNFTISTKFTANFYLKMVRPESFLPAVSISEMKSALESKLEKMYGADAGLIDGAVGNYGNFPPTFSMQFLHFGANFFC